MLSLPVVDFDADRSAADIADEVERAVTEHGFMAVANLGIDPALRQAAFAAAEGFFTQPAAAKAPFGYTDPAINFGYQALLAERLDPNSPADVKEAFTMRNLLAVEDAAAWPDEEFQRVARAFYSACMEGARRVLRALASVLRVEEDFFVRYHTGENVTMRYLYYPSTGAEVGAGQLGAGAHTDYGAITLLFQDQVPGLELRDKQGVWQPVPTNPDLILINTGDLMTHWSNGRFPSTEHRVAPRIGSTSRYSIAYFMDPDNATLVECLPSCVSADQPARFEPITAGEHILRKITATL